MGDMSPNLNLNLAPNLNLPLGLRFYVPENGTEETRACFQSGFASGFEMAGAEARREKGTYSKKSVTDEQRSISASQPKYDGKCTLKTRPNQSPRTAGSGSVKQPDWHLPPDDSQAHATT